MNLWFVRSAKIAGLLIAAVAVVLLAELLFFLGVPATMNLPRSEPMSDRVGAVTERVTGRDPTVPELWLAEIDGDATAVVAVASAPGYRSRIEVAVTVASDGTILSEAVAAHSESAYVRHALDRGGADALSGATLTEAGIRAATGAAVAAARDYIEEQW